MKRAVLPLLLLPLLAGQNSTNTNGNVVTTPQFVQTNTVTVTGVIVATTLVGTGVGTVTLPANFFAVAGSVLNVDYGGTWNGAGSSTTDSLLISLGGTTIASGSLATSGTGTFACSMHLTITARTVGASGSVIILSPGMICNNATTQNPWFVALGTVTTPVTINTTIAQAFNITITPGAASKTYVSTNLVLRGY